MNPQKQINFNVIGEAVKMVAAQWQAFVLAGLLGAVAIGFVAGLLWFASLAMGILGSERPVTVLVMLPFMLIGVLAMFVLTSVVHAGLVHMGLKAADGEQVQFADVMEPLKAPLPFMFAGLLIGLGVAIGSVFCTAPGLIIAGLTMFTFPLMLDKKLAPLDAIKQSVEMLKSNWLMATLFYFVVSLLGNLGSIACYFGLLFTIPTSMVCIALCYRDYNSTASAAMAEVENSETL